MPLNKSLKIENVVILATNFNPSIVSSVWLLSKGICNADEILPNSFNTPQFSQIVCTDFQILVLPDQLQFSKTANFQGDFTKVIKDKLSRILKELPEVPYRSAGINFHWFVNESNADISVLSRKLFYNSESKIYNEFNNPSSQFGAYLSKDFSGSRLKLDIKPVIFAENNQTPISAIQFAFNFHTDFVGENLHQNVLNYLNKFEEYSIESNRLIGLYD